MQKLSALGIGPKIGIVAIPYVIIAIVLTVVYPEIFSFGPVMKMPFRIAGFVILAIGLVFYVATAKALLTGLRHNKLMTTGPYKYSQNPLYAVMILLIIPGLALVLNSWIILTGSVLAYIIFKKNIHTEYKEMEKFFGDDYLEYRKRTPELFLLMQTKP